MFLAGIIFSAIACFARADYNLPMFALLYLMWDQDQNEKLKLVVLMGLAFLGDLLWMLYWIPFWHNETMAKWNQGLHSLVILCVTGECVLKLIILLAFTQVKSAELDNRYKNQTFLNGSVG